VQGGLREAVQQRGQPCSVSRFEPDPLPVELALQYGKLVT
jgi:hypothetical protein